MGDQINYKWYIWGRPGTLCKTEACAHVGPHDEPETCNGDYNIADYCAMETIASHNNIMCEVAAHARKKSGNRCPKCNLVIGTKLSMCPYINSTACAINKFINTRIVPLILAASTMIYDTTRTNASLCAVIKYVNGNVHAMIKGINDHPSAAYLPLINMIVMNLAGSDYVITVKCKHDQDAMNKCYDICKFNECKGDWINIWVLESSLCIVSHSMRAHIIIEPTAFEAI
jgi:hypothetical protein